MDYFPLFFNLKHKKCLVVGAGTIAARKIELIAKSGVKITVLSQSISPQVYDLQSQYNLELIEKTFQADDIIGFSLIISATNNIHVNQQVAESANQHKIPINVVDTPRLCDFIFPAIIDRSPIITAVSSGGSSPVLARLLRAKLETLIPHSYGNLARLAEKYRDKVKASIKNTQQRKIFWENTLQGSIAELVHADNLSQAENLLSQSIENTESTAELGEVYLIGAGPGAADLLTFRALRLMQQADVVLYDRLVSSEILDLTRREAEKIYVGKQRKNHAVPQNSINELLVTYAKQGKCVVRLKGGDPFIFGRGGEEIETLMQQNIHFQVVPGITAASGCATYAGIPLTHRDHAQSCTFVTGHLKDGTIDLQWKQLAIPNQTIVFYMGLSGLKEICQSLIEHGLPNTHPIALIQQGTTKNQQVVTGTLSTLPTEIAEKNIKAPTLIIVGSVVTLHDKLNWFKN